MILIRYFTYTCLRKDEGEKGATMV